MKPLLLTSFLFLTTLLHGFADTIRMMQYNMMYYTTSVPSGCTISGTYMDEKDENLKKIIDFVLPDVFCVNEIGSQDNYVNRVLNNVMNANGRNYYARCPLTNYSNSSIANMLYYDSRKLAFYNHLYVTTYPRDINAYKMYYKSAELAQGDTAFITFIIAHLKAGNTESDRNARKTQVERLTTKIEQMGIDNYVFSGDFNLYKASEAAYQHLLFYNNTAFRFLDPIDEYGNWNNNNQFANVHTQSTHSSNDGCFSSGGLDDRFDFILVSPTVFYGAQKVKVMPESYYALGQDGQRLNGTILNPANHTLPEEILNAMYNFSDHLPVICSFEISKMTNIHEYKPTYLVHVENPVKNELLIQLYAETDQWFHFEIFSITGQRIDHFSEYFISGNHSLSRKFDVVPSFYFLKITNALNETVVKKLIK